MFHNKINQVNNKTCINTSKIDIYFCKCVIIVFGIIITILCLFIIIYNGLFHFPLERRKKSKVLITMKLFFSYSLQILSVIILQFDDKKYFFTFISGIKFSCSLSIISFYLLILYECYKFLKEKEISLRKEKTLGLFCWVIPYVITICFFIIMEYIPNKDKKTCNDMYIIYVQIYFGLFCIIYGMNFIVLALFIKDILKYNEITFYFCNLAIHNSVIMFIFSLDLFNMVYFLFEGYFYDSEYFNLIRIFLEMSIIFLFIVFFKPSFPDFFCNKKSKTVSENTSSTLSSHISESQNDF